MVGVELGGAPQCLLDLAPNLHRRGTRLELGRARLVSDIDEKGTEEFTLETIAELDRRNSELLQMAHNFASVMGDYLQAMQGFALLHRSLIVQSHAERARPH